MDVFSLPVLKERGKTSWQKRVIPAPLFSRGRETPEAQSVIRP
jgi:hypothetical protein